MKTWLFYTPMVDPTTSQVYRELVGVVDDSWAQAALDHPLLVGQKEEDGSIALVSLYGRLEPLVDDDDPEPGDNPQPATDADDAPGK